MRQLRRLLLAVFVGYWLGFLMPSNKKRKKQTKGKNQMVEEEEEVLVSDEDPSGELEPDRPPATNMEALAAKLDEVSGCLVQLSARMDRLQPLEALPAHMEKLQPLENLLSMVAQIQQSTQEALAKLQQQEQRMGHLEQKLQQCEAAGKSSAETVEELRNKVEALEGTLRRRNLRLVGFEQVPAQSPMDLHAFVEKTLRHVIQLPAEGSLDILEVVKLSRLVKNGPTTFTSIVTFCHAARRDEILKRFREATNKGLLNWEGISGTFAVYPDLPRREFAFVKRLAKQLNVENFVVFPATLILVVNDSRKSFTMPEEAEAFLKKLPAAC